MNRANERGEMETTIYPGTLYDYTAGVYCGVLVTERVMRKLAALQEMHKEAVQRLLMDNPDDVFPSMWTLHYPDGKQTSVSYIDRSRGLRESISRAVTSAQPVAKYPVFIASSMDEARSLADARHAAQENVP